MAEFNIFLDGLREPERLPQAIAEVQQSLDNLRATLLFCEYKPGFAPPDFHREEWTRVNVLADLIGEELAGFVDPPADG
jgi:hypothetical protein